MKKAFYYLKRNGVIHTWNAVRERVSERKNPPYFYVEPSAESLGWQREQSKVMADVIGMISIVVPTYRTPEQYLRELIDSVMVQSYPNWELVLADASGNEQVQSILEKYNDQRIRYIRLEDNKGIAENTNAGLEQARGSYIALLDHDDVLTPDALYEMALHMEKGGSIFYSDEDKCNGDRTEYYEPNRKEGFNLDLFLSNNYICHFLIMKSELMKDLKLRKEFDGAQDYDLLLRGVEKFLHCEEEIVHVSKVLYHWRCHSSSTASNPQSKEYAYEAGRRAVKDFVDRRAWGVEVRHMKHLGFYEISYPAGPLHHRSDLGAVGGRILSSGKIFSGRLDEMGKVFYRGLDSHYSGEMHRAILTQDAAAVDIRCVRMRTECIPLFEEVVGVPYRELPGTAIFDASVLPKDTDFQEVSVRLGQAVRDAGYRILYQPSMTVRI